MASEMKNAVREGEQAGGLGMKFEKLTHGYWRNHIRKTMLTAAGKGILKMSVRTHARALGVLPYAIFASSRVGVGSLTAMHCLYARPECELGRRFFLDAKHTSCRTHTCSLEPLDIPSHLSAGAILSAVTYIYLDIEL